MTLLTDGGNFWLLLFDLLMGNSTSCSNRTMSHKISVGSKSDFLVPFGSVGDLRASLHSSAIVRKVSQMSCSRRNLTLVMSDWRKGGGSLNGNDLRNCNASGQWEVQLSWTSANRRLSTSWRLDDDLVWIWFFLTCLLSKFNEVNNSSHSLHMYNSLFSNCESDKDDKSSLCAEMK